MILQYFDEYSTDELRDLGHRAFALAAVEWLEAHSQTLAASIWRFAVVEGRYVADESARSERGV